MKVELKKVKGKIVLFQVSDLLLMYKSGSIKAVGLTDAVMIAKNKLTKKEIDENFKQNIEQRYVYVPENMLELVVETHLKGRILE